MSTPCSVSFILSLDYGKQDAANTTEHSKRLIELKKKELTSTLSTIWENNYGCAENYICASALYVISILYQCFSIIIYRGISAPGLPI